MMAQAAKKRLKEIFEHSQFSVTSHERLLKQTKQLYDKVSESDFTAEFVRCLQVPLFHGEKHRAVENVLNFASNFVASFLQSNPSTEAEEEHEEEICPFALNVLKFLFEHHHTEHQAIRFRVCQFINKILNGLGNEACIDDNICDQISECMMERLQDKAPAVRMQAVLALHRLQDPMDTNCPVMKAFIFHMKSDPNADVRRAVITNIASTSLSVKAILERTHDTKDAVRRTAYATLSKLGAQRFSITQRVNLLTNGFKDHSAIVRDCVSKVMLPQWLVYYKGSFLSLLHALDCENSTEISSLALQALFKSEPIGIVYEELTKLLNDDKVIPIEELSPENVLYWRVLHEHLEAHPDIGDSRPIDEPLPELLPELSTFCNYIRQYFEAKSVEEVEDWVKLQHQYILIQLLELCKSFDLADEMGRTNLRSLCFYFLSNSAISEDVVPILVELIARVSPNVEEYLQALAEAISEVREPMTEQEPELASTVPIPPPVPTLSGDELRQREVKQAAIRVKINELKEEQDNAIRDEDFVRAQTLKEEFHKLQFELKTLIEVPSAPAPLPDNSQAPPRTEARDAVKDEVALRKCLRIVKEMVQSKSVINLSATLRSLMQNFVLPCLQEDNSHVIRNKALEALGLFCLLDKPLAQENFLMFIFQIANDDVCEVALKVTFDMLLLYGLETFQIQEDNGETSTKKKSKKKKNLFVTDMFDDEFDTEEEESQGTHTNISSGSSGNTSNLISMLTSLLDSASTSMRNIAMEGLYKLLAACRITSWALLSRLILMWYSPVTDGDELLRQPLGVFLTVYATHCPRSQETLEQAFMPTLRTLMQAPITSPLSAVDQDSVTRLFVSLTRPGANKFHSKASHIHNNMATSICNAVLDSDDSTNLGVLLRALCSLELSLDDPVYCEELLTLMKRMKEVFRATKEKQFLRYMDKLYRAVESADSESMRTAEVNNTETPSQLEDTDAHKTSDSTTTIDNSAPSKRDQFDKLLHLRSSIAENDNDDEEDEEYSQKQPQHGSDNLHIPESPPRSQRTDSEDEDVSEPSGKTNKEAKKSVHAVAKDVFKKPPLKDKSRGYPVQDQEKKAATDESDTSPVAKRRKACAERNLKQLDKEQGVKDPNVDSDSSNATVSKSQPEKDVVLPVKRAARGVEKDTEALVMKSSKRNVYPTEKGATLKTFQRLSSSGTSGTEKSKSSSFGSSQSVSPSKQVKKPLPKDSSEPEKGEGLSAKVSEVSSINSPNKKSTSHIHTRRSGLSQTSNDSLDSPPSSASALKKLQSTKETTKSLKTVSVPESNKSSPSVPYTRNKSRRLPGKVNDDCTSENTSSLIESVSSPLLGTKTRNVRGAEMPLWRKAINSPLSGMRTRNVKVADSLPTESVDKNSQFESETTDSDSSPIALKVKKRALRQNKKPNQSPSQSTLKLTRSSKVLDKVSDVDSDASPASKTARLEKNNQSQKQHALQQPSKIDRRAKTSSSPRMTTRRSVSLSDGDPTSQSSGSEVSSLPRKPTPPRPNTNDKVKLVLRDLQKKTTKKSESYSFSSPVRISTRGQPQDHTKGVKRTAESVFSSSGSVDSDSPQVSSRSSNVGKGAVRISTPLQPDKKARTRPPNESKTASPTRRSLRSQADTPSPRTRSGKT